LLDAIQNPPPGYEHITPQMCLACKGAKALCGKPCILLARIDNRLPRLRVTSQDVQGPSPPSLFIGRYGYPDVAYGPLLPPIDLPDEKAAPLDDPAVWAQSSIQDILGMRSSLLRTAHRTRVTDATAPTRFLRLTQELAMAARPVDTEIHLAKKPNLELTARVGDVAAPMGPRLDAVRGRLAENPRIDNPIERAVGDTDALAADTSHELYRSGVPVHRIEHLLSVGLLGASDRRRLVPTRWSITATDDMLGKALIPQILERPTLDAVEVYRNTLHGNRFHVFLLPQVWSFDMIETWIKGAMWALATSPFIQDSEDWQGRTRYASNITGAYYAARLGILEHLAARRRQAAAFVYREITPEYWAPLGVWLIREAVRQAMVTTPRRFETIGQAVAAVEPETQRNGWAHASALLGAAHRQRRLAEFL
jgi:hypothetical protein